ncbi:unnamed protein product [Durusdinium trenchii]|uniref:Transmembrane protein n=1 Tax=Durusdinium trenchii TaxID=1381693 RepID=A0ABP0JLQ2_9DINO
MSVPDEALPALVAGGVGIVAAVVFVCSGASSQPTTWDKEEKDDKKREDKEKRKGKEDGRKQTDTEEEDEDSDADGDGEDDGHSRKDGRTDAPTVLEAKAAKNTEMKDGEPTKKDLPVDFLKMRRGKLSPEQEAKFRQGLANLPPESRKALKDWVEMTGTDSSTWTLLGLNCLFLVFILGVITLAAAAVVGFFQINIFSLDVWRQGLNKLAEGEGPWSNVPSQRPAVREIAHDRHDLAEL